MEFEVVFDNSENNPFNPNPNEYVMWGDQTWEEMAVAFFEIATPVKSDAVALLNRRGRENATQEKISTSETSSVASQWARDYIRRFDKNGDSRVARAETNELIRRYSFSTIDADGDGFLTSEELVKSFEERRGR